ncbi:transposase [Streptomyces sp. PmtA]
MASRYRDDLFDCLTARGDELFELVDALLCADGPVRAPVDLTLVAEHRRGHGAMYDALNSGNVDDPRLRQVLAGLPMPQAGDGRLVLAVDISHWLRPDAPTSPDRLFCHVYGRSGRSSDQYIPGWPYSFVAALESGRTSWCQLLDAVRLGPDDDVAEVTAAQGRLRRGITLVWAPDIRPVTDAATELGKVCRGRLHRRPRQLVPGQTRPDPADRQAHRRNDRVRGVLPRRWVAERTFAWLMNSRRLARDDETLPVASEALIRASPAVRSRDR